jgi:hypothetical protein
MTPPWGVERKGYAGAQSDAPRRGLIVALAEKNLLPIIATSHHVVEQTIHSCPLLGNRYSPGTMTQGILNESRKISASAMMIDLTPDWLELADHNVELDASDKVMFVVK